MWIKVSEKLPDLDVPVWLYEAGRIYLGGRVEDDGWLWAQCYGQIWWTSNPGWKGDLESDDDYAPTHWMPLPEPPKDKP